MTRAEFLRSLESQLELPPETLQGPETLESIEQWDSMTMMTFIALAESNNGVKLSPRQLSSCETVDDLLAAAHVQQG